MPSGLSVLDLPSDASPALTDLVHVFSTAGSDRKATLEAIKNLIEEELGISANDFVRIAGSLSASESYLVRKQLRLSTAADQTAETYGAAHDLENSAVAKLSHFLNGLEDIGIRDSLHDVAFYAAEFQPASGPTAYSLLGTADLAISGAPTRGRYGFIFDGNDDPTSPTTPQRLYGSIFSSDGEWTILGHDARSYYVPETTGQRRAFNALQTSPLEMAIFMQNGSNYQGYTFETGVAASVNSSKLPRDPLYRPLIMRNAAVAAADSLSVRRFDTTAVTGQGRGAVEFDKLCIGAGTTNGSSFSQFFDGVSGYWAAWSDLLTDTQIDELGALLDESVAKKVRIVMEGDSIVTDSIGWGRHLQSRPAFFGANIEPIQVGAGGAPSPIMVTQIGTADGINDTQKSDSIPVICLIQAGSNDKDDTPDAAGTLANLRALWQAARDRGMIVVACTVPGATTFDTGEAGEFWTGNSGPLSHTVRGEINTGIRADTDRYDYLLDVDALLEAEWGATYWQDTDCFSDGVHPGQSETGAGGLVMDAFAVMIAPMMP